MNTLAKRLGLTTHTSVLDYKIRNLFAAYPSNTAELVEDWLLDVANARGAKVVQRDDPPDKAFRPPPADKLSDEELAVAICMTQRLDRPQLLRLSAQIITRGLIDIRRLIHIAKMERIEPVIGEMAKQAMKVDPEHPVWKLLADAFPPQKALRSPIIHWQRLAWPVMSTKGYNAEKWILVG